VLIFPLLLIFINRGLFVASAYEIDNRENGEINTLVEWVALLLTGECNDLDEDGDEQSLLNCLKIVQPVICQQNAQISLLANLFANNVIKFQVPKKITLPDTEFYLKIDYPPEG